MAQTRLRGGFGSFLVAIVLVTYMSAAALTSIYTMLSTLYRVFDDPQRIGWTVSAYFLVGAAGSAICGRLGDLFGRRHLVIAVLCISGLGALLGALSTSLNVVIAGCALLGMASALTPLIMGIVREALPQEKLAMAISVVATVGQVGGGLAFLMAGAVIDRFSISGGFTMLVLLALLSMVAMLAFVPRDAAHENRLRDIEIAVGILFAPAIAGIFIAIELGRQLGWQDLRTLGLLAASLAVLVGWTVHQWRQDKPLINVRSLATRQIGLANLLMVLLCLGTMEFGQIAPLYLQQPIWTGTGFELSPTVAGTVLMMFNLIAIAGGPWSGHLAGRHGARYATLVGGAIVLAGWTGLLINHHSFWLFVGCMVVAQLGLSISLPAIYNLIVEATPPERTSEATGLNYVFMCTFFAVGSQVIFLLLATSTVSGTAGATGSYPADEAYLLTFRYVIGISLLTLLVAWALPRRKAGPIRAADHA